MGTCAHCQCDVHRGDPFVVTLSDKLIHTDCVQPYFERLVRGEPPPPVQPSHYTMGDESPF